MRPTDVKSLIVIFHLQIVFHLRDSNPGSGDRQIILAGHNLFNWCFELPIINWLMRPFRWRDGWLSSRAPNQPFSRLNREIERFSLLTCFATSDSFDSYHFLFEIAESVSSPLSLSLSLSHTHTHTHTHIPTLSFFSAIFHPHTQQIHSHNLFYYYSLSEMCIHTLTVSFSLALFHHLFHSKIVIAIFNLWSLFEDVRLFFFREGQCKECFLSLFCPRVGCSMIVFHHCRDAPTLATWLRTQWKGKVSKKTAGFEPTIFGVSVFLSLLSVIKNVYPIKACSSW